MEIIQNDEMNYTMANLNSAIVWFEDWLLSLDKRREKMEEGKEVSLVLENKKDLPFPKGMVPLSTVDSRTVKDSRGKMYKVASDGSLRRVK